CQKCDTAPWTF
nr:immunoglobulin light chain junction region [Macaca mulatta]MOX07114.1 immunoglobulin light chain junction region [Macaca mulatta]MOX07141.1 immunoglobulin light chain junction region [Macaca mulatta]MOX07173.1 immunoglobulin light chain junction region [Macaca mulatta]MOX07205.1 immunoglobulin light chain junction region [Macaca mulatta]